MNQKSEAKIQQEIVQFFRTNYYQKGIIFSVPNERSGYAQMKVLLNTGLLSGVSDLIVVLEGKVIFVEVKNYKGTQSAKQKKFQSNVESLGHKYYLVRTLDDFKNILKNERNI